MLEKIRRRAFMFSAFLGTAACLPFYGFRKETVKKPYAWMLVTRWNRKRMCSGNSPPYPWFYAPSDSGADARAKRSLVLSNTSDLDVVEFYRLAGENNTYRIGYPTPLGDHEYTASEYLERLAALLSSPDCVSHDSFINYEIFPLYR